MSQLPEEPGVKTMRREAGVVMLTWFAALLYSVTYCYLNGYDRSLDSLTFVLGFPDWVFWGLVVPWVICCLLSCWFAFGFIREEDLGEDRNGDEEVIDG